MRTKRPDEVQRVIAQVAASPVVNAASLLLEFGPKADSLTLEALIQELERQCYATSTADWSRAEELLLTQAHALQAIFCSCASKMASAQVVNHYQTYGLLALKAQNQCRATLATLAEIKNPTRATFIKNTATNQQVNLGEPKISANSANEVLDSKPYERLDSGTPSAAVAADPTLEAVGARHRPKDGRRKGALPRKRI
jgi:hypothetical protein